jgi:hypothetical protein
MAKDDFVRRDFEIHHQRSLVAVARPSAGFPTQSRAKGATRRRRNEGTRRFRLDACLK